jgi:adenine-specific DNA-methyltransferase
VLQDDLTTIAAQQQRLFDSITSPIERKEQGHFGTPPAIARFMAGLFTKFPSRIRILDPGAGVGTLSAAVCQRILADRQPRDVRFELWENDPKLIPLLEQTMSRCRKALREQGHEMTFEVKQEDFILANTQSNLFSEGPRPTFEFAILNPPYFKLRKNSPQAHAMQHVVYGQPNIYILFMAVAADLLRPDGEIVAITPRSYFNGPYFKRFRKWFFDQMTVRQIHVFESRTEAFKSDSVLQENVILHAEKHGARSEVRLTTSFGRELTGIKTRCVEYEQTVDHRNGDHVIRVTTNALEHEIVNRIDALPHRFKQMGFEISTGPVVTFRSTEFLRNERSDNTAPLLWMHNVRPFATKFLPKNGKPTHIEVSPISRKLLVPAKTYILMKRFTSKEQKRRLVAGIIVPRDSYSPWLGLENHLNYVYRKGGDLTEAEAFGVAAYFNSAIVDLYFRAISGNTQVNATEIRSMPVPEEETLSKIGEQVRELKTFDSSSIDRIVGSALRFPSLVVNRLMEAT